MEMDLTTGLYLSIEEKISREADLGSQSGLSSRGASVSHPLKGEGLRLGCEVHGAVHTTVLLTSV